MDSNYDILLYEKYNIKFDQNKHLCDSIYNNLSKIFEWNQQSHYKMHQRLCKMKNMENFDMKKCSQYADISKKITNIKQVHKKPPSYSEYSSDYFLKLDNGNLEIIYEF
jgi:hypothetical protein